MSNFRYIFLGILGLLIGVDFLMSKTLSFGAIRVFNSSQVGISPQNGYYLQTDGTNSTWASVSTSGGSDPFTHPSSSVSATTTTLEANSFINSNGDVLGQTATLVVSTSTATGQYTDIQSAIDALPTNGGIVYIRSGTYTLSTGLSITKSNTTLQGEGLKATTIQCDGSSIGLCVSIATTTSLSQIKIRDLKILQTNVTNQGVGLDISDAANVYLDTIRIESFATSTRKFDSANTAFYGQVNNLISFDNNTCIEIGGTQANANMWTNVRCRPKSGAGGFGVFMSNARNNNFYNLDAEPSSAGTITGVYIDATSRDNSFYGSWIEANSKGILIESGANNISFFGGTVSANSTDITDNGTNDMFLGVNRNGTKLFTMPSLTISGLASASGTFIAANASGQLIATSSPHGAVFSFGRSAFNSNNAAATVYYDTSYTSTTETDVGNIMPYSGTLKNLYIDMYNNTVNTGTIVFTIMQNGSDTGLTVTVNAGVTSITGDTTHTAPVSQGDRISLKSVAGGATGTYYFGFSYELQ